MIQLLLLKEEQDWNGYSHLQNDGLSLAGETLVVLGLTGAIRLPREGSGTAQSSQAFRHSTTGLCLFVNKRRGAGDGETRAGLSSPLHRWIWTECYWCWRTNRHQMTSDEMQKCCWQWQIPLFPLLFILRCQDKRQRYDVLEGMKEEL